CRCGRMTAAKHPFSKVVKPPMTKVAQRQRPLSKVAPATAFQGLRSSPLSKIAKRPLSTAAQPPSSSPRRQYQPQIPSIHIPISNEVGDADAGEGAWTPLGEKLAEVVAVDDTVGVENAEARGGAGERGRGGGVESSGAELACMLGGER